MISLDCVTLERRNISFGPVSRTFKEGECVAVMGENGAGKTTLLDLISGLETPSSGAVDSSSRVSYAPPSIHLPGYLTHRRRVMIHSSFRPFLMSSPILSVALGEASA